MKKKIFFTLLTIFILIFSLASCNNETEKSNDDEVKTTIKTLDSPVLTLTDQTVSWDKIADADYYVVNLNNKDLAKQTSTSYTLQASENGEYVIKVKAGSNNTDLFKASNESESVTIYIYDEQLSTPTIVNNDDFTISWNSIKHADKYVINVNGEDKDTVTELSYDYSDLKTGDYTLKIKAKSNSYDYGMSEYSNEINISYVWERKLEAPVAKIITSSLVWDEVENATSYEVYLDDEKVSTTNSCKYTLSILTGSHKLKVKALSTNTRYETSDFSTEISYKNSKTGYLDENTGDFLEYLGDSTAYVQVTNATELFNAIKNAKWNYTTTITDVVKSMGYEEVKNVRKQANWIKHLGLGLYIKLEDGSYYKIPEDTPWDENDPVYTSELKYYHAYSDNDIVDYSQTLTKVGTVHVIEIMNDLELGWKKLTSAEQELGVASSFGKTTSENSYTMSSMFNEYGMTQINVSNTNDLLIFSKNGSKITHAGFNVFGCNNVCFRNIEFDEMWQWEDASSSSIGKVGDMDAFGWAYFKISSSNEIWIDHCTFGKSYDGQIDISDSTFNIRSICNTNKVPYGVSPTAKSNVHISWCEFTSGSDDHDGYLYKMMQEIETDYQANGNHYLYYKALRDAGYTFDEILYGIAIPQKKAFLDGDANEGDYKDKIEINDNLNLSIAFCKFIDVEDRIPKVRTGNVYMYGTVIDCSRYYSYLPVIKSKGSINAKDVVRAVNSTWKCAGVSHALISSMYGSIYAYGCIIKGVNYVICNNEDYAGPGGVIIENSKYIIDDINFKGSIYDENNPFMTHKDGNISPDAFNWNTENNSIPFLVDDINVDELENLNAHIGTFEADNPTLVENYYLKSIAHI